jgi:hypothetical protein
VVSEAEKWANEHRIELIEKQVEALIEKLRRLDGNNDVH